MRESKFFDEVLAEGRIEGRRAVLLETLESRFGSARAAKLGDVLAGVSDPKRLAELQRIAARCRRFTDFRQALTETTARR